MTNLIDKIGFYKNRNGEKVGIVQIVGDRCFDEGGFNYETTGRYWINEYKVSGCDIIAKWEESKQAQKFSVTIAPDVFWLVWTPYGQNPTKKHESQEEAQREAMRLLKKHPEKQFYVMYCDGVAEAKIEYQYNSTF